ncbi:hypothetical protein EB118_20625, partial [bacterium]|nr:hypothetical protein [bacterium]
MGQSAPGTPGTPGPKGDKGDKGDKGEQGETQLDTSNMSALSDRIVKNKYLYTGITSNLTDNDKYVSQLSAAFSDNQLRKISDAMVQPDTKLLNNLSDKLIQDYYQKLPQAQITDGDVNTKIKPKTLWCADGEICTLPKSVQRSYFTGDVVINPGAKFLFGIDNGAKGAPDVKTGVLEWASNDNNWTYGPFMYGKDGGQLGVRDHQGNTIGATLTWGPDNVTINHGDLTVGDGTRGNIIMRGSEFKIHNGIAGLGTGGTAISMDAAETLVLNEFGHFDNGVRISGRLETDRDVRIGSIGSGGNLYVGSFGGGGGSITQYGPDLKISYKGRGSGGRALVHETDNKLVLNYNGDFTGGTLIGGPKLAIDGDVEFGKGIQVAGGNISFKVGNVSKRALFADSGDRLTINRNNEFTGGTLVEGPKLSVLNNLEVGNTDSSTNSAGNIALYGNKIEFKQGTPGNGGIALFADPQSDTLTISKGDSFVGGTFVD